MAYAPSWLDGLPAIAAARMSDDAPSRGTESYFSQDLCELIKAHLGSIDAVELLILLHSHPERGWSVDELMLAATHPLGGRRAVAAQMTQFSSGGIASFEAQRYRYQPRTERIRAAVDAIALAYNERPVSLVRLIYYLRNHKVQSFAEAFRIGRD